jgi:hypothetical protein
MEEKEEKQMTTYMNSSTITNTPANSIVSVCLNEMNEYSVSELNYIRDSIENMNKFNQIEILRILSKHQEVVLNENKYGVHINLSELPKKVVDELNLYIHYVNTQEITLGAVEKQKEEFKNIYFTKDNKDKEENNIVESHE